MGKITQAHSVSAPIVIHLITGDEGYGVATVLRQFCNYFPEVAFMAIAPGKMSAELAAERLLWIGSCRLNTAIGRSTVKGLLTILSIIPRIWRIGGEISKALPDDGVLLHCHSLSTVLVAGVVRVRRGKDRTKVLFHFHSTMNPKRLFGLLPVLQRFVIENITDGIVAVSRAVGDYWKPVACPIWIVHNGMAPHVPGNAPAYFRRRTGVSDILIAGSLSFDKGHAVAVEALRILHSRNKRLHLWIAGGPLDHQSNAFAKRLAETVRRYGLSEQVTFLGEVPDLRDLARAVSIGLQQRISPEPCSMWVLEAMEAGLPLIASATGGTPELIRHEQEGLLVPPNDPEAVAAAITRLVEDAVLRERMARAARLRARTFSQAEFVLKMRDVYRAITVR